MAICSSNRSRFSRTFPRRLSNNLFLIAAITLALAVPAFGQVAKEVHRVLEEQVAAWNRGDIEGYMQGYWNSDSTVFISGGSVLRGWKNVLERYKKSYGTREKMGRLEFSELTIRLLSSTAAIAHGVWKLSRVSDQPWGRFTLIVEKKPEGWRITQDHTSSAEK